VCYQEYERVISTFVPDITHMTRPYFSLITALASQNTAAALLYDAKHRSHRDRLLWPTNYAMRIETEWLDASLRASPTPTATAAPVSSARVRSRPTLPQSDSAAPIAATPRTNPCLNWNTGFACNPRNVVDGKCKYTHVCSECGGQHKQSDCTALPPSRNRGRGRGIRRGPTRNFSHRS